MPVLIMHLSLFERMLNDKSNSGLLDINCCDPLGRSALLMGIDNENLEMVELLLDHKVMLEYSSMEM